MAIQGVAFVFVFVLFVFVFVIVLCQGIGRTRNVLQRTASLAGNGSSHFRLDNVNRQILKHFLQLSGV